MYPLMNHPTGSLRRVTRDAAPLGTLRGSIVLAVEKEQDSLYLSEHQRKSMSFSMRSMSDDAASILCGGNLSPSIQPSQVTTLSLSLSLCWRSFMPCKRFVHTVTEVKPFLLAAAGVFVRRRGAAGVCARAHHRRYPQ